MARKSFDEAVRSAFTRLGLPAPQSVRKIAVGFTNEVYAVDDDYILKVCVRADNVKPFGREAVFYRQFEGTLPVPKVLAYDTSRSLLDHDYMICTRIRGANLYNVWHELSHQQREDLIRQLCGLLRQINDTDPKIFPAGMIAPMPDWAGYVGGQIERYLRICEMAGTLSPAFAASVREYTSDHIQVLDEAKVALTYFDPHFDNILVADGRITGLLDLERTEMASIDYVLDLVWRMVCKPTKYMSEYAKQFARDEDYADLMRMYEAFYPELFAFDELPTRLNLYLIAHDLRDLALWRELGMGSQVGQLARGIADIVKAPVSI